MLPNKLGSWVLGSLLVAAGCGTQHPAPGAAPEAQSQGLVGCIPSRAMLVLDKSSSMQTGTIGGATKWSIAVSAVDQVTQEFQSSIELGLMLFPSPNQCAPGSVFVDPALNTRAAITAQLGTPPPTAGNWTPMAQTLEAAQSVPSLQDGSKNRYVVLVTDGWQWCSPYDASTRFTPVSEVSALKAMGVTTYVVGFGNEVDALTLNKMAVAAGTARPGCDPAGSTPTAWAPCYYQADSATELKDALREIALQVSAEICDDGIDNDCDGLIDENCGCNPGEQRACGSQLNQGACKPGYEVCNANRKWSGCMGEVLPSPEVCDGVDNDCDGQVDENLTKGCSSACGIGKMECVNGQYTACSAPMPQPEICDGIDNDCNLLTDEDCDCLPGTEQTCGPPDACELGKQVCDASGKWGACVGAREKSEEICDGIDNDCNGEIDEPKGEQYSLCPPGLECVMGNCVAIMPTGDDHGATPNAPGPDDSGAAPEEEFGSDTSGCQMAPRGHLSGTVFGLIALALLLARRRA